MADDIFCLDDGPRVLDCIEFDQALRLGDGLADAAFLAMDLERLGRADLGERFLAAYREHAGDAWPPSLAHHQIAYRAQVRAKVTAIRAAQGDAAAAEQARALLELCARRLEKGRVQLVIVGGLPGSGKSTLAVAVANGIDATVVSADEVRKELAGLAPTDRAEAPYGEGLYTPERTAETYRTLLGRARVALERGESVVLDASWTDPAWRARAAELAVAALADHTEFRCEAPRPLMVERMTRRRAKGHDPSDATPAIADAMAAAFEPSRTAITISTDRPKDEAAAEALRHVTSPPLVRIGSSDPGG